MFKLITILFIQVLCGMEMDLFIPSFPELQNVFNLSPFMVQMTISINFTAFCICSLFAGALGDKYNRRTVLILGLCIFVLGSLLCVFTPNYFGLILGRALQGIGISAPAILSFPVLLENYAKEKQPGAMGLVNGVKTLAMAIAPVIGSFVNLYFSWRGNFSVLLGMGVLCLIASYFSVPSKAGNHDVSLSLNTYVPLLKSKKLLTFFAGISLLTGAYWLFTGMAPILYMQGMAVPLEQYGYYQGSLSLVFAIVCILSPQLYRLFGQKRCLYFGMIVCLISAIFLLGVSLLQIKHPMVITVILLFFSLGIVFPINILYPFSLEVLPHTKGRSAGLGQSILLSLTAFLIEMVAYFYHGEFMPIGLTMFVAIMLSIFLIHRIMQNKWLTL
ncbi:MAG: MFS transporter [Proteobacteria bacterium]|nr:MFS transporter [Pseudomonadota bacterium]